MEKKKSFRRFYQENRPVILIAALAFLALLPLNLLTPMLSDDYAYCYSFADHERIRSLWDIVRSQAAHYQIMNGRFVLHALAQLSLMLPHWIFKIANAAMYAGLGLLIYRHIIYGKAPAQRPVLLTLIYIALWMWLPLFGETVLWQDGACNYLWGTCLILLFLLPYREYAANGDTFRKKRWTFLMPVLGFLAGACNENASGAACMAAVLFLIRFRLQKKKLPLWSVLGIAGGAAGFFTMLLAPGNLNRAQAIMAVGDESFLVVDSLQDLLAKFNWISMKISGVAGIWLVFLTLFLGAYLIFRDGKFQKMEIPVIYLLCMLGGFYAMLIPPIFPERAMFGPVVFWIIGLGGMMTELTFRKDRAVTLALLTCLLAVNAVQYVEALKQNMLVYHKFQQRISYVQEQKNQGNLDLVFEYVEPHGRYCAWSDMTGDPDDFYNRGYANYHGLDSVVITGGPEAEE